VVTYRDRQGRSRKRFARTLAEARDVKASLRVNRHRGDDSRERFDAYAGRWIDGYTGRTARGVSIETIRDYRRQLGIGEDGEPVERNGKQVGAVAFFGRMRLRDIRPMDVKQYATELRQRGLSTNSIRLALAPVRALFADAVETGDLSISPSA